MRLLVTGGAGYIGSVVTVHLLRRRARGHRGRRPVDRPRRRCRRPGRGSYRPGSTRPPRCWPARTSTACCISPPSRWWASRWSIPSATGENNIVGDAGPAGRGPRRRGAPAGLLLHRRRPTASRPRCRSPRPPRRRRPTRTARRKLAIDLMLAVRGGRPRAGRGEPALLQRRRRGRPARASGTPRDPPDPDRAAGRGRAARIAARSSATTTRRRTAPASATTSTSTTWPGRTCSALDAATPGEHRIYNLGNGAGFSVRAGRRGGPGGHRPSAADDGRAAPGRATRRSWSRRARVRDELAGLDAGSADACSRTWSPTPGDFAGRATCSDQVSMTRRAADPASRAALRRGAETVLGGTGPGQRDRRAHRLQRRLRAADRAADGAPSRRSRGGPTACSASGVRQRPRRGRSGSHSPTSRPGAVDRLGGLRRRGRLGAARGRPPGRRLTSWCARDVPEGAGLSSSAALECAVGAAVADLSAGTRQSHGRTSPGWRSTSRTTSSARPPGSWTRPRRCGAASGHALLLDARSLEASQVPFDLAAEGLTLLVIDTRAPHAHVDGEYAARRRSCEEAAADPRRGLAAGAPERSALDGRGSTGWTTITRRRVRHVVTENARVLRTVDLLRGGRVREIGPLLTASHASLRDDYEVSVPRARRRGRRGAGTPARTAPG